MSLSRRCSAIPAAVVPVKAKPGPLSGCTIAVTAHRRADDLIASFERRGAKVLHAPTLQIVPAPDEVPGGFQGAVGDAVDIGREGFGDEGDTHTAVVGAPCVEGTKGIFPAGERSTAFCCASHIFGFPAVGVARRSAALCRASFLAFPPW